MRFTFDVPDSFDYMVLGKTKVTTDVRKINAESAARVFTQGLLLAVRNASANAVVNTADGLDQKDRYKAMSKAEQSAWADLHAVDVLLTAVTMTQKKVDAIERNDWAAQTSDGGDAVA